MGAFVKPLDGWLSSCYRICLYSVTQHKAYFEDFTFYACMNLYSMYFHLHPFVLGTFYTILHEDGFMYLVYAQI